MPELFINGFDLSPYIVPHEVYGIMVGGTERPLVTCAKVLREFRLLFRGASINVFYKGLAYKDLYYHRAGLFIYISIRNLARIGKVDGQICLIFDQE